MTELRCFDCCLCGGHFSTNGPPIDDTRGDKPGGSACDECAEILNGLLDSGAVSPGMPGGGKIIEEAFKEAGRPLGCNA